MYILYHKQHYIVQEELTKNRTHQTWRGNQLKMCEEKQPLQDWIDKQPEKYRNDYYIEPDGETQSKLLEATK